jgi:small subunit ribosomal protein S4
MQEKQFLLFFERALRMPGITGENLFVLLERRLDNVVYRLRFAVSRTQARQLVLHGHIMVNGRRVNIPSYLVRPEDVIEIKEPSKNLVVIKQALKEFGKSGVMPWLQLDPDGMKGKFLAAPRRSDITDLADIKEQMIVEYYSK